MEPLKVILPEGAVRVQTLFESIPVNRIYPWGLNEGRGIVGAQIDNQGINLSACEIIGLKGAQLFIDRAAAESAEHLIAGGDVAVRIGVPAGKHAPAALRDQIGVRIQGFCDHPGVIAAVAHIHGNPVRIFLGTVSPFSGSDAVAHKFQCIFLPGNRIKGSIRLQSVDQQIAVFIFRHSLQFAGKSHIFNSSFTHTPEQTQLVSARHEHLPAHQLSVDLTGDPYFMYVVPCFDINPEL